MFSQSSRFPRKGFDFPGGEGSISVPMDVLGSVFQEFEPHPSMALLPLGPCNAAFHCPGMSQDPD